MVLETIFLFPEYDLVIENWLFPFGLMFSVIELSKRRVDLWLVAPVLLMFFWELACTTIVYGRTDSGDLMYLLRILKLPVVFTISASMLNVSRTNSVIVVRSVFYLLAAINLFIVLDPFGAGSELQMAYSMKSADLFSTFNEPGYFRLSGTFRNPNDNALLMGVFLLFFLALSFKEYWKEIVLATAIIFLTQSRTALIALLVCLSVAATVPAFRGSGKKMWVYISSILVILTFLVVAKPHNLYSLVNGDAFRSYSWNTRVVLFMEFWDSPSQMILTGYGLITDVRDYFGLYLDSEYSAVLYQFGVIGLFLWVLIWFGFIVRSEISFNLILLVVFVLVISITNYTVHNPLISPVLFFMLPFFIKRGSKHPKTAVSNNAAKT